MIWVAPAALAALAALVFWVLVRRAGSEATALRLELARFEELREPMATVRADVRMLRTDLPALGRRARRAGRAARADRAGTTYP